MRTKIFIPLIVLVLLSLACGLPAVGAQSAENEPVFASQPTETSAADPTDAPTLQPTEEPTLEPTAEPTEQASAEPTSAPVSGKPQNGKGGGNAQPTAAATSGDCPAYSDNTLASGLSCWNTEDVYTVTKVQNPQKVTVGMEEGRLLFDIRTNEELYLYLFNETNEYEDVIVEADFVNIVPGVNRNGAILLCQVNDNGWYEARVESAGFFHVFRFDTELNRNNENPYISLKEGATTKIKLGYNATNHVEWACTGSDLTLSLNGEVIWTDDVREPAAGQVGVGVNTYKDYYPVVLGFEKIGVQEP